MGLYKLIAIKLLNTVRFNFSKTSCIILLFFQFSFSQAQNTVEIQSFLDSAEVLKEVKPKEALQYGLKAKILAEKTKNNKLLAVSHQKIATVYRILNQLKKAEEHINIALNFPIDDYDNLVEFNITKGIILKQQCRFQESLECYNNTLIVQQSQNDKAGEGRTYNNIGRIYEAMELYSDALIYYRKAYSIYEKLPINKGTGLIITNIGHVYRFTNQPDSALYYYQIALPIYKEINNPILEAYAYRSMASVVNDEDTAINYLNKSIDIIKKTGSVKELGDPYLGLGEIYYKNKAYNKAIKALLNIDNNHSDSLISNVYRDALKILYSSYDSIGDYKNALHYQHLYFELKDAIKSNNNLRAMQEYESNIKLKEKQTENKIQKIELENTNEKLKLEYELNLYFLAGVVLLALLLLVVIVQVVKQYKNNKTLKFQKAEIQKRDKEKEVLIREIHHRVKNNLQIISSLLKLDQRKTDNPEVKLILNKSTQRIEAIAYIHEKLYQQNDLTDVDLEDYLYDIAENLLLSFDKLKIIDLNIQTKVKDLHADVALNLGLLTAELITNSIKHGYNIAQSNFIINLKITKQSNAIVFDYSDNGPKMINFNNLEKPKSFGMNLIKSTIKKMNGELIKSANNAVGFKLMFKFKNHE